MIPIESTPSDLRSALTAGIMTAAESAQHYWHRAQPLTGCPFPDHGVVLNETMAPPDKRAISNATRGFVDWVNVIGLPAIGLPTHVDARGVPFGVQLVGGAYTEELLLRISATLEENYRWYERRLPEELR